MRIRNDYCTWDTVLWTDQNCCFCILLLLLLERSTMAFSSFCVFEIKRKRQQHFYFLSLFFFLSISIISLFPIVRFLNFSFLSSSFYQIYFSASIWNTHTHEVIRPFPTEIIMIIAYWIQHTHTHTLPKFVWTFFIQVKFR